MENLNVHSLQNDFNTEGINNKSNALLALVKSLKKEGLIDGVGFQSHFIVGEVPQDLQANLQRFVDAGVEVAITELDIRVCTINWPRPLRWLICFRLRCQSRRL